MTRYTLEVELDYHFLLFGISCHAKDYRLAHFINVALEIQLQKMSDYALFVKKTSLPFSYFNFKTEALNYSLIANKSGNNLFIAEMPHVDYWFKIDGITDELNESEILQTIRGIDIVLTVQKTDPNQLKSKQHLILE